MQLDSLSRSCEWNDSCVTVKCVTWRVCHCHVCDMTHVSYTDMCVSNLIQYRCHVCDQFWCYVCDMTHLYVWRNSFIHMCVTWLIRMRDVIPSIAILKELRHTYEWVMCDISSNSDSAIDDERNQVAAHAGGWSCANYITDLTHFTYITWIVYFTCNTYITYTWPRI